MNPPQLQPPQPQSLQPQSPQQSPPPKVPLSRLATDFLGALDNEALPEIIRLLAGYCRQLTLHVERDQLLLQQLKEAVKRLTAERLVDLKQIDDNFGRVAALFEHAGSQESQPGGEEQGVPGEAPAEGPAAAEQPLPAPAAAPRMPRRQRPGSAP